MTFKAYKAEAEYLDFTIDYSDHMEAYGDQISVSVWTVPTGSLVTVVEEANDQFTATAYVSGGGANGERNRIINKITTLTGLEYERTIEIETIER